MRRNLGRVIRRIAACIALLGVSAATHAAQPNAELATGGGIFIDVPAPNLRVNVRESVSRRRPVTVDFAKLRASRTSRARLAFNLFPDAAYEGAIESIVNRGPDEFTLLGSLTDQPWSSFALSVKDGVVVGNFRLLDGRVYQLHPLGNSFYDVRQLDETKYPPCGNQAKHAVSFPSKGGVAPDAKAGGGAQYDGPGQIDVLVVYTAQARTAAGGNAAMQAKVNLAIDESNTAYQMSGISTRLRLVYQQEVGYTQSATFDTDLDRLTNTGDGYLDEVHTLRNAYGADMVCMLIDNSQYCGLAWLMTTLSTNFASSAFSVVDQSCATGYYSFAHELGHNMGCAHDVANSGGPGLYPYSYGWRFNGTNGTEYRTIMAYAPGTRIQRFSNPNTNYFGTATGVATNLPSAAHNALTINNVAATVANFRQAATNLTNCLYFLASYGTNISSAPALGTITLSTSSNTCAWIATNQAPAWLSIIGATNGTGSAVINWSATTNSGTTARTGTVAVAGQVYTIVQSAWVMVIPLATALDVPGTTWATGGGAPWFGTNYLAHDNVDAGRSGVIDDFGTSYAETVVNGPGTLSFWWKVSSETDYDFLSFYLDNAFVAEITGEVNWAQVFVPLTAGPHTLRWQYDKDVSFASGDDAGWVDQVQMPRTDFKILSLTNNATVLDHSALTGDDRGGLAASATHVLCSGDSATARFNLTDLSGGTGLGLVYDGLVSDLRTETMFLLASNNTPVSGSNFSGLVNRLLELGPTGVTNGNYIQLSQSIPVGGARGASQSGVFSGYGQIALHNRTNVFSIALPSGLVNELGPLAEPIHVPSDTWAYWGVAEYFSNSTYLVYVKTNTAIYRVRVAGGTTNTVATFANLGDMASFTVSVPRSRWYFHHETASQFAAAGETIGYAGARFGFVPSGYFTPGQTRWLGNSVRMEFRGPPLTTAVLEYSTDMNAWTALATNVINTNGILLHTNSAPAAPHRFYRARVP